MLKLGFLEAGKRANQKINDDREKAALKAQRSVRDLKIAFGCAKQKFGADRLFKVINVTASSAL